MAYQTKTRDPLLETHMQEAIRKRGTELIGLALVGLAVLFAAMLAVLLSFFSTIVEAGPLATTNRAPAPWPSHPAIQAPNS